MADELVPLTTERWLTAPGFRGLVPVPSELEWFANISKPQTRRSYQAAMTDFMSFIGIQRPEDFRIVMRLHVIT